MLAEELRVVAQANSAVCVHGNVVPGRNDASGLLLGAIPRWCDVGIGSAEDDQRFRGAARDTLTMRIGAREVADQHPHRSGGAVDEEWEMGGKQPSRLRARYQCRERMRFDK